MPNAGTANGGASPPTGARSQKRDIGAAPYAREGFLITLIIRRQSGVTCRSELRLSGAAPREEPLSGATRTLPIGHAYRVPNHLIPVAFVVG